MKKDIPYYYQKPIKLLRNVRPGEWVYNSDANLCYVGTEPDEFGYVTLHHYCIEQHSPGDVYVYPLTLATKAIMEDMEKHRDKYHKSNMMNPNVSRYLEGKLHKLMLIDNSDESAREQYEAIWKQLDDNFDKMLAHKNALDNPEFN